MRIKETSILNVVTSERYREHHIFFTASLLKKEYSNSIEAKILLDSRVKFLKETKFRKLVLSANASEDIFTNYKAPKELNYQVLRTLPNRKDIIMIDEKNCIVYSKDNNEIHFSYNLLDDDGLFTNFFTINLETEKLSFDGAELGKDGSKQKFIANYINLILIVTYLELTDIKIEMIMAGKSSGIYKKDKIKNDTKTNFIFVKGNWNTRKIVLTDFSVRGHWRLQPYGHGRTQFKYIFIEPFEKGISRRLAQKELVN